MKLKHLKMTNFLSYPQQEIDFTQYKGLVLLLGRIEGNSNESNGSGKSTIFDAISWCLYGQGRVSDDDMLIRGTEKDMSVSLVFEIDNKEYHILRQKKRGKSQVLSLSMLEDGNKGTSLTGNAVKETQKKIIDVLGMDSDLYENAIFSRQGCIDLFPRQNPSKRKEILSQILQLDKYETWENQAKEMARTYEMECSNIKAVINQLEISFNNIQVSDTDILKVQLEINTIQETIKQVEVDLNNVTEQYNSVKTTVQLLDKEHENFDRIKDDIARIRYQLNGIDGNRKESLKKVLQEKENDLESIKDEVRLQGILEELNTKIKGEEELVNRYQLLTQEHQSLIKEQNNLKQVLTETDKDLNKLRSKVSQFKELGNKCPLCLSDLSEENKTKVMAEIVTEGKDKRKYFDELQEKYNKMQEQIMNISKELGSMNSKSLKSKELERDKDKYEKQMVNIQISKNRLEYVDNKIKELESMYDTQKKELTWDLNKKEDELLKSDKAIEGYKKKLVDVDRLVNEMNDLKHNKDVSIQQEKSLTEQYNKYKFQLQEKENIANQLATNEVKLNSFRDNLYVYNELTKAFGKNGIPLYVIENALAELQSEVSRQLDILSSGRITVEFATQKELKSGKVSDTLDILVSDKEGTRDFNVFSGGEKMRVALAIRLALSKLISRRAGKKFLLLIIDEISDLDTDGIVKFTDLLNTVSQDYEQIFVVSHIDELKDRFNQVIQVVKENNESRII